MCFGKSVITNEFQAKPRKYEEAACQWTAPPLDPALQVKTVKLHADSRAKTYYKPNKDVGSYRFSQKFVD